MTHNPNLERLAYALNARLKQAAENATASHVHAGLHTGVGQVQTGPVLNWRFDTEDREGYGEIAIVNYEGETLVRPLVRAVEADIRPCWDRCKDAPAVKPDGEMARSAQIDTGAADRAERDRQTAVDTLYGEFTDEAHADRFTTHMRGLEAVITMTFDALLGVAYEFVGDDPASRAAAREALASLLLQKATEEIQGAFAAHDTESES